MIKNTKNIILITVTLMVFVIFAIEASFSLYENERKSLELHQALLETEVVNEAQALDSRLGEVCYNARVLALLIENDDSFNTDLYDSFIKETLESEGMVFGMGYWFEPYAYDEELMHFGPYLYKDETGQVVKTMEYSTSEYDYMSWDWYNNSIVADEVLVFSAPFYDEYLDTVFMSAAVKIMKDDVQIGVVSIDVTLREINAYLASLEEEYDAFSLVTTTDGHLWGRSDLKINSYEDRLIDFEENELSRLGSAMESVNGSLKEADNAGGTIKDKGVWSEIFNDYMYVWTTIGDTDLNLIMGYDRNEIRHNVWVSVLINGVYFTVAMTVFIFFLNLVLVRRIQTPLVKILSMGIDEDNEVIDYYDKNIVGEASIDHMIELIEQLLKERNQHVLELNEQNDVLEELLEEVRNGYIITVRSLSNAIEAKDSYTKGHCESVTTYSLAIAKELGIGDEDLVVLEYASLLHDVGKIGVPSSILNKPGKLTDEEFTIIMSHPAIGYEILKDIDFLKRSALIVYQHHERVDGKGYPRGVVGAELDILTKIITVADAYDAMTSARPYRLNPISHEKAIAILKEGRDTQFDGQVIDVFIKVLEER